MLTSPGRLGFAFVTKPSESSAAEQTYIGVFWPIPFGLSKSIASNKHGQITAHGKHANLDSLSFEIPALLVLGWAGLE